MKPQKMKSRISFCHIAMSIFDCDAHEMITVKTLLLFHPIALSKWWCPLTLLMSLLKAMICCGWLWDAIICGSHLLWTAQRNRLDIRSVQNKQVCMLRAASRDRAKHIKVVSLWLDVSYSYVTEFQGSWCTVQMDTVSCRFSTYIWRVPWLLRPAEHENPLLFGRKYQN